jgi:serpin B
MEERRDAGGQAMRGRTRLTALVAFVSGVLLLGTATGVQAGEPQAREFLEPGSTGFAQRSVISEPKAVRTANDFGFELLKRLHAQREDDRANIFISPLSVSMSLGMLMNGAGGETFDAMGHTLGLEGLTVDEANVGYKDLSELLLRLGSSVELRLANHSWLDESFQVRRDYRSRVEVFFDAAIENVRFEEPSMAGTINGWVGETTGGRISELVTPDEFRGLVALLVNSVYFEGKWADPFDPAETVMIGFLQADGSTVNVPTMRQELDARVGGGEDYGEDYVAVDLPYGGQAFSMTVVVPLGESTLSGLVEEMDDARWRELIDALRGEARTEVRLPRFELAYEKVLNDVLKAMGMGVAFDGSNADFGWLMGNQSLGAVPHIGWMKQKTFLRVDEEGTETAAATGTAFAAEGNPVLQADRPFLFAIREKESGAILFLGTVTDPTK